MRGRLHRVLDPESISILAQAFGPGRTIWIPDSTAAAQRYEILIGLEQTSRLIENFGGNPVYLPGLRPPDGRARGPSLREVERLSRKLSAAAIAQRFGCSARTIYNKRAKLAQLKAGRNRK
jgi:hypothetical protein